MPPTLISLFDDASLDPTRWDWVAKMSTFHIDKDDAVTNTPTPCLRNMVVMPGALSQLLAYITIGRGETLHFPGAVGQQSC